MKIRFMILMIVTSTALGGCFYTPREVADPPTITLNDALTDVADSLNNVQLRSAGRQKVGLLVDEVQVVFNVSSKATSTGKLGVTTTATPIPIGGTFGLNASGELVSEGLRGNVITVKFKNVATADMSKSKFTAPDICSGPNPPPSCPVIFFDQTLTPPARGRGL